ncbi:MAG: hypothetical protein V4564_16835 [Pseudomonadota bacterium]
MRLPAHDVVRADRAPAQQARRHVGTKCFGARDQAAVINGNAMQSGKGAQRRGGVGGAPANA